MSNFRFEYRYPGARSIYLGKSNRAIMVPFECVVTDIEDVISGVGRIRLVVDLVDKVLRPTSVEVTAIDGRTVTGSTLRELRIDALAVEAAALSFGIATALEEHPGRWGLVIEGFGFTDEDRERFRRDYPAPEVLEAVADAYEFGRLLGLPPAREVELQLGLPRTTASKWIRRARDEGHLEDWRDKDALQQSGRGEPAFTIQRQETVMKEAGLGEHPEEA